MIQLRHNNTLIQLEKIFQKKMILKNKKQKIIKIFLLFNLALKIKLTKIKLMISNYPKLLRSKIQKIKLFINRVKKNYFYLIKIFRPLSTTLILYLNKNILLNFKIYKNKGQQKKLKNKIFNQLNTPVFKNNLMIVSIKI